MIAIKITIQNSSTEIESFKDFEDLGMILVGSERNSFLEDLKFCIKQGWIKNLKNISFDSESKTAIYEYYSEDLHRARYFQNYLSAKPYFSTGMKTLSDNGWKLAFETVVEKTIIPFIDADRLFDEDIEVLA